MRPRIAPIGRFGVWAHYDKLSAPVATRIEELGYGAVWIGGSPDADLRTAEELLGATEHLVVATGIVNIWKDDAHAVAASHARLRAAFPDRFLLGVGVGHPEATSDYRRPYRALTDYLDALDDDGVAQDERVLAALGPKVLHLSADRASGAHPYLTTPEHTRTARELLGPDVLLAPEHKVVLNDDAQHARAAAREIVGYYLGLGNYVANLQRLGFSDDDVANGGSDRLVDAVVAHGSAERIAARLHEHLDAGADHVAVQVVTDGPIVDGLARLADTLNG